MNKLVFKNGFDALLCLDGTLPDSDFFKKLPGMPVIAADGAALRLFKKDVFSDYIVGDLDSFKKGAKPGDFLKSEIIHLPDQETNDFEKALVFAQRKGFKTILICGFHGGDLEHTLNNWSVLKKCSTALQLCIYERGRYAIPVFKSVEFRAFKSEVISLIPQPDAGLTTAGLEWPLSQESLTLGVREGARNRAIAENVSIEVHSGEILLFIDARLPYAPEFL